MPTTTQRALARFTKSTLRAARIQDAFGDRRFATYLRASVSDALAERRAAMPTPAALAPADPELAKRRAIARAWAETMQVAVGRPRS